MHAIFHHLRFEIRGHRLFLLIWFVMLAVSAFHWGFRFEVVDADQLRGRLFPNPSPWLDFFACLIALSLGIRDTPSGTRGFWLTRPLRARQLLSAKLLFLFALVLLPWAIHDALISIGQGGGALRAVLAQAATQWALPCIAFGLATLTDSPLRALLAAACGLAALGIVIPLLITLRNVLTRGAMLDHVFLLAWLVGLAALIGSARMFLTRRPRSAWKVTIFSAFGLLAVGLGFALPASNQILSEDRLKALGIDAIEISIVDQNWGEDARMTESGRRKYVHARANLDIDGLPGQFVARARLENGRIEFPDSSTRNWAGYRLPSLNSRTEFRHASPIPTLLENPDLILIPPDDDFRLTPREISIRMTPDDGFPTSAPNTAKFSGEAAIELVEFSLLGSIPLKKGCILETEAYRIELVDVEIFRHAIPNDASQTTGLQATVRSRRNGNPLAGADASAAVFVFLHHPQKGVVVLTKSDGMHPRLSGPVGLHFDIRELRYRNPGGEFGPIDESWLDEAELIVIQRESVGEIRRRIEISELRLGSD